MGRGGGLVVNALPFYLDDLSSYPIEVIFFQSYFFVKNGPTVLLFTNTIFLNIIVGLVIGI